ncbi:MAG TPA: hypothetical protein VFQ61_35030 [Polyangiaceae bacterium]|nr:hypothetical protein [Polyangiaceae bacterium]
MTKVSLANGAVLGLAVVLLELSFTGCARKTSPRPGPPGVPSAGFPASGGTRLESTTPPAIPSAVPMAPSACRVMRVSGEARIGPHGSASERTIQGNDAISGEDWLDLAQDAAVVVRHGNSAREFSLRGPGLFLPCRNGQEQLVVANGVFRSSPGTGARPGGEFWVFTPHQALWYADADLELEVKAELSRAELRSGKVFPEGAAPLRSGAHVWRATLSVSQRVQACEEAAHAARQAAMDLLEPRTPNPTAGANYGERARAHFVARRLARARCGLAHAVLETAGAPDDAPRLRDQLNRADSLWQLPPTFAR